MPVLPCSCGKILKYELPDKTKPYVVTCSTCGEKHWVTEVMTILPRLFCVNCGGFFFPKIDKSTGKVKIPKKCPVNTCRRPWNRIIDKSLGRPKMSLSLSLSS